MGISSTQTLLKYIYHSYNDCPAILLDAKIMAVIFGSCILMITSAKPCPSQKFMSIATRKQFAKKV
jgi:hypothetical protein